MIIVFLAVLISLVLTIRLSRDPVIVLVILDGFSYNIFKNSEPSSYPNFQRVIKGVGSKGGHFLGRFIPCYPTKTWPNLYSIVTGMYPENHGIVANRFYDPNLKQIFDYKNQTSSMNPYFYGGNPFWNLIVDSGLRSACFNFPMCSIDIGSKYPTYNSAYDFSIPNYVRVEKVLNWLDLSSDQRPQFILTYMNDIDLIGHIFGPDSSYEKQTVKDVDTQLGVLYDGILSRNKQIDIDLIIVSDHGFDMIKGIIFLEDYINVEEYLIPELTGGSTPQLAIWANQSQIHILLEQLNRMPLSQVFLKQQLPFSWHYSNNDRIAPILVIAQEGYLITTRNYYYSNPSEFIGGNHGWHPDLVNMSGIIIGSGPSFLNSIPDDISMKNIDLFNIMASILHVYPTQNDGIFPYFPGILSSSAILEYPITNNTLNQTIEN